MLVVDDFLAFSLLFAYFLKGVPMLLRILLLMFALFHSQQLSDYLFLEARTLSRILVLRNFSER